MLEYLYLIVTVPGCLRAGKRCAPFPANVHHVGNMLEMRWLHSCFAKLPFALLLFLGCEKSNLL